MIAIYTIILTFCGYYLSHISYNKRVKAEIQIFIANKHCLESLSGSGQIRIMDEVKELNKWLANIKNKNYKSWLLSLNTENKNAIKELEFIKIKEEK